MKNIQLLKQWMYDNQYDMELMARNICKNSMWEDLRSETILRFEKNKDIPDDIIINDKYFYYVYGAMQRIYTSSSTKFIETYTFNGYDDIDVEEVDEVYDEEKDEKVQLIYDVLKKLIKDKDVNLYDAKCFILYYIPQYSPIWVDLSLEDYLFLNKKTSWRNIGKILGINHQSLRLSSLKVLNKINNKINN